MERSLLHFIYGTFEVLHLAAFSSFSGLYPGTILFIHSRLNRPLRCVASAHLWLIQIVCQFLVGLMCASKSDHPTYCCLLLVLIGQKVGTYGVWGPPMMRVCQGLARWRCIRLETSVAAPGKA